MRVLYLVRKKLKLRTNKQKQNKDILLYLYNLCGIYEYVTKTMSNSQKIIQNNCFHNKKSIY